MPTEKTVVDVIASAIKKAPKRGLTAAIIAERTGIALNTVRTTLASLVKANTASIVGKETTGTRGRPSNLYGKVAA